ncbi:hypothetical protein LTR84_001184 [Exophiala bonariae]|uniref:Shikimate dehydrogenase substrate binding N-terminal domain-containing protein n=1 Tax=Exophiala bonariae TaxID=1690606 RepID=A0AAV9NSP3_9EURO|nr:hypothetical protein LTR84_001184 [Exophiala bonariae]
MKDSVLGSQVASLASTLDASYTYGTSLRKSLASDQSYGTFLLGYPISKSLAPMLQNKLFCLAGLSWKYRLLESADQDDLLPHLASQDCVGAAVTMPHKVTFLTKVDDVTMEGRAIGAINTVFIRQSPMGHRRYIGTNTDCIGVREAFLRNISPEGLARGTSSPALVIGGGGACRSAIFALHEWFNVQTIYLVNRFKSEVDSIIRDFSQIPGWKAKLLHVDYVAQAQKADSPYFIVGTVPDYPPSTVEENLASEIVKAFLMSGLTTEKGMVLEMCYFPRVRTTFFELAEANGWQVIAGTEAMIWQGVAQQVLWTEDLLPATGSIVDTASEMISKEITV